MLSLNYLKPSSEHFARFLIVALVAVRNSIKINNSVLYF